MAVWKKVNFKPTPIQGTGIDVWTVDCYRELIDTFFGTWDCSFVEKEYKTDVAQTDLTIAEDTILSYRYFDSHVDLYVNDEYYCGVAEMGHKITIWIVYSDTVFYIVHAFDDTRVFVYLYEIIDDKIYEGWDHGVSFQSLTIKEKENEESLEYRHHKILDYKTQFKYIDYTDSTLFEVSGEPATYSYIDLTDDNFISCSIVPVDTIISFNETRHFSIDTNTLVAIDPVEPYEEEGTEEEDEGEEE